MINKNLIHDRFAKNLESYNDNAKIQKRMAERLLTFVKNRSPKKILEIALCIQHNSRLSHLIISERRMPRLDIHP